MSSVPHLGDHAKERHSSLRHFVAFRALWPSSSLIRPSARIRHLGMEGARLRVGLFGLSACVGPLSPGLLSRARVPASLGSCTRSASSAFRASPDPGPSVRAALVSSGAVGSASSGRVGVLGSFGHCLPAVGYLGESGAPSSGHADFGSSAWRLFWHIRPSSPVSAISAWRVGCHVVHAGGCAMLVCLWSVYARRRPFLASIVPGHVLSVGVTDHAMGRPVLVSQVGGYGAWC